MDGPAAELTTGPNTRRVGTAGFDASGGVSGKYHETHSRYLWARAGVKRQLTNTRFSGATALGVGAEVTLQGNNDGQAYQAGAVVAFDLLRARASLQLRGGYARLQYPTGPSESRPYLGVGIYQAF